eukprot:TRINITY_DN67274_c0_g1_i1.p1 TRINITY_DN67274_c0_g1~~TRINITY_DN67274_c0_g1_i1.p1  ORF type:complete len:342 (+),score=62.86 TRINITY_DN67274_c0_g1_i1:64-1026(+)
MLLLVLALAHTLLVDGQPHSHVQQSAESSTIRDKLALLEAAMSASIRRDNILRHAAPGDDDGVLAADPKSKREDVPVAGGIQGAGDCGKNGSHGSRKRTRSEKERRHFEIPCGEKPTAGVCGTDRKQLCMLDANCDKNHLVGCGAGGARICRFCDGVGQVKCSAIASSSGLPCHEEPAEGVCGGDPKQLCYLDVACYHQPLDGCRANGVLLCRLCGGEDQVECPEVESNGTNATSGSGNESTTQGDAATGSTSSAAAGATSTSAAGTTKAGGVASTTSTSTGAPGASSGQTTTAAGDASSSKDKQGAGASSGPTTTAAGG